MQKSIQSPDTIQIPRALAEQTASILFAFSDFLAHADTIGHTARTLIKHGETRAAVWQLEMLASLGDNAADAKSPAYALWEAVEAADKAQGV